MFRFKHFKKLDYQFYKLDLPTPPNATINIAKENKDYKIEVWDSNNVFEGFAPTIYKAIPVANVLHIDMLKAHQKAYKKQFKKAIDSKRRVIYVFKHDSRIVVSVNKSKMFCVNFIANCYSSELNGYLSSGLFKRLEDTEMFVFRLLEIVKRTFGEN